ncbi:hypothetical protein [Bacteroides zoogleoformans]|uniref:hypothetical protein n=1 Tax=Bacteroides zoogleoformans TaxID=28119 RepID=UPI00248F3F9F|nr:hypothetical protein [Bacteroides zoogleoformans]
MILIIAVSTDKPGAVLLIFNRHLYFGATPEPYRHRIKSVSTATKELRRNDRADTILNFKQPSA